MIATNLDPPPFARPPAPRSTRLLADRNARKVEAVVLVNAAITIVIWVLHGGFGTLQTPGGILTGAGQVTGLVGTYAVLVELLLMSRIAWLERSIGLDRLAVWHRWTGFAALTLLALHVVFITAGYAAADHRTFVAEFWDFIQHYPDVLMSIVGFGLFVAVAVTSVRAARRRVNRETWYLVHLYAYLAVALSFAHQLAVGSDFSNDARARLWWSALYVAVFGAIIVWRVGYPVWFNARHRLRIAAVRPEAKGVVSLYVSGRRLAELRGEAGQFFLWRFLTRPGWARAHPFSLSACPNDRFLRITVKDLGDDSHRMQHLRRGTRVFAEGPYGTFTASLRTKRRIALIAGGIGITPLRALLDALPGGPGDLTLLYRVPTKADVAFTNELAALVDRRGVDVRILVGIEIGDDDTDHLGVRALRRHIPDIAERDVYVCGPPAMLDAVRRRLTLLGVPAEQIHFERFEF
jgi:predicted ferric reductase